MGEHLRREHVRVAVALGRACDNACVFCAQEGLPREAESDARVDAALEQAMSSGARAVTFVGGEPALDLRLASFVAKARAAGFTQVGVQTNGVALAAAGRMSELAARGLTDVHLSCTAPSRASTTGTPAWRAPSTPPCERSAPHGRLASRWPSSRSSRARRSACCRGSRACSPRREWPRGASTSPSGEDARPRLGDRVIPRLALALPFALHALDAAAKLGLPAFVRGAPACLLGPFAAAALEAPARSFSEVCGACPCRPSCAGVDAEYLARFGEGELSNRPLVAADPRHAALRELFVGPGELAPPPEAPVHSTPERARVALPLLGRPAPARAEVPASAPKQTGDALRAILPGLFEEPGSHSGER